MNHVRAILVNVSLRAFNASKFDKKVSEETLKAHGASADAGRFTKALLSKTDVSYQKLIKHLRDTRTEHYAQTLPWNDNGDRILPNANHGPYTTMIRARKHEYDVLLAEFVADYQNAKDNARIRLNGMFKEEDFPEDIASKFGYSLEFKPVPDAGDFRVTLSDEEMKILVESTEESYRNRMQSAQDEAVKRLFKVVSNMQEACANPEKIFRDTLVTNARDVCDALTRLNIGDDANLERLRKTTEELARVEPETLRKVPEVRKETAETAQGILDAMTSIYGDFAKVREETSGIN